MEPWNTGTKNDQAILGGWTAKKGFPFVDGIPVRFVIETGEMEKLTRYIDLGGVYVSCITAERFVRVQLELDPTINGMQGDLLEDENVITVSSIAFSAEVSEYQSEEGMVVVMTMEKSLWGIQNDMVSVAKLMKQTRTVAEKFTHQDFWSS